MAGKVCQQGGTEAVGRRCRPKLSVQAGGFAQDTFFVIFQAEMSGQFMADRTFLSTQQGCRYSGWKR